MTIESTLHVRVPAEHAARLELLREKAKAAAERLEHATLGDRTELVRFEQITSEIEGIGYEILAEDATQAVSRSGKDTITLTWPFAKGNSKQPAQTRRVRAPASVWRSSTPRASRTEAAYERFEAQLKAWAQPVPGDPSEKPAVCPSGIQNRALTEALRKFVNIELDSVPVEAPVVYLDGSQARSFPLRSISLVDHEPEDGREIVRMTLLSVRHFEMDAKVDGAWLRNREISLPRARAQTDELVYQQSLTQFEAFGSSGPLTLYIYQTGLEAANVGFYRALVNYQRGHDRQPISVIPHYFAGEDRFVKGMPWTMA